MKANLLDRLQYRHRRTRPASRRGFRNFSEFSRLHVVDIAVDRYVIGNEGVVSNTPNVLDDALCVVRG